MSGLVLTGGLAVPIVRKKNKALSKLQMALLIALAVVVAVFIAGLYAVQQQRVSEAAEEATQYNAGLVAPTVTATPSLTATVEPSAPTLETTFAEGIPETVAGFPLAVTNNSAVGAEYTVVDGRLTNTASGAQSAASYLQADMGEPVQRMGAEFVFIEGASPEFDNGSVMIGVWETSIVESFPTIPNSPTHLVITRNGWQYGVWDTATGNDVIAKGKFIEPLAAGEEYAVDIMLVGDTASFTLPDGATRSITDPRIESRSGPFACWEVFQNDAAIESKAAFVKVWAS